MFQTLAQDYLGGPPPNEIEKSKPELQAAQAVPAPAPADTEASNSVAGPVSTAEFEVEVEGEVFKVRVTGAGMTVMSAAGAAEAAGSSGAPPPKSGEGTVIAPMQGLIVKMQNDIVTTVAGRISHVYVKEGEVVSPNQPLLAVS